MTNAIVKTMIFPVIIYTSEEILRITTEVQDQIDISNKAIKNNYFSYLEKNLKKYEVVEQPEVKPEENTN